MHVEIIVPQNIICDYMEALSSLDADMIYVIPGTRVCRNKKTGQVETLGVDVIHLRIDFDVMNWQRIHRLQKRGYMKYVEAVEDDCVTFVQILRRRGSVDLMIDGVKQD